MKTTPSWLEPPLKIAPTTGIALTRPHDANPWRVGEVGAAWLRPDEIAGCERSQGIEATPVLGVQRGVGVVGRAAREDGARLVAYVVLAADRGGWVHPDEMTERDIEDHDAWSGTSRPHRATVRLATPDEAAELVAARARLAERYEGGER